MYNSTLVVHPYAGGTDAADPYSGIAAVRVVVVWTRSIVV